MKKRNDDLNGLELLELLFAENAKGNDPRALEIKKWVIQLKAENESLINQNEELEKNNSSWKMQAEKTAEQYHKLAMTKKRLESKIKLFEIKDHIEIPFPSIYANEMVSDVAMSANKKRTHRIDVNWMIEYAQNTPLTRQQAVVIKDMLMHYYLNVSKAPRADVFELLQIIDRIPQEYDNNHRPEPQPIVHTAAQVVVSNNGKVEYYNNKKNGKHGK